MKKTILAVALGLTAITAQAGRWSEFQQHQIDNWQQKGFNVEKLDVVITTCNAYLESLIAKGKEADLTYKRIPRWMDPASAGVGNQAYKLSWYQNSKGEYVAISCLKPDNADEQVQKQLNVKVTTTAEHLNKLMSDEIDEINKAHDASEKAKKDKLTDLGLL